MKPLAITCLTLVIAAIAISSVGVAQGRYWPSSWRHAYVHGDAQGVYVTYVEDAGCRDQKIELRGYQMVGEGHAYCHLGDRPALHFKRAGY